MDRELDSNYKKEIIELFDSNCRYGGKKMQIDAAIGAYTLDVLGCMMTPARKIKELKFVEKSECNIGNI